MKVELLKRAKRAISIQIKRHTPENICPSQNMATNLNRAQRRLRELQSQDYSHLPLSASTEDSIRQVKEAAESIYGDRWNYYSNALRREVVQVFEMCIRGLSQSSQKIDYLEIGSCQGLSMSIIARLLINSSALGKLVSVDPYFAEGYVEGGLGIWEKNDEITIDKTTRNNAYSLYNLLKLEVHHIEEVSFVGLKSLICSNRHFNLIYIDGSHEGMNPLRDLGLSFELAAPGGIIILDDHHWPDVKVIKELCDCHCNKIAESWKVAAYEVAP